MPSLNERVMLENTAKNFINLFWREISGTNIKEAVLHVKISLYANKFK